MQHGSTDNLDGVPETWSMRITEKVILFVRTINSTAATNSAHATKLVFAYNHGVQHRANDNADEAPEKSAFIMQMMESSNWLKIARRRPGAIF